MFYVYILYSPSINKYYIGYTKNLQDSFRRHNEHRSGFRKFTKRATDWQLVYFEKYDDKSTALKREREIKKKKSREYIENLIAKNLE